MSNKIFIFRYLYFLSKIISYLFIYLCIVSIEHDYLTSFYLVNRTSVRLYQMGLFQIWSCLVIHWSDHIFLCLTNNASFLIWMFLLLKIYFNCFTSEFIHPIKLRDWLLKSTSSTLTTNLNTTNRFLNNKNEFDSYYDLNKQIETPV